MKKAAALCCAWQVLSHSMSRFTAIVLLVAFSCSARAGSGAAVPWTTYEAEAMTTTGLTLGPQYSPNVVASEASGRKCVQIGGTGQYVQFTALAAANSMVVRYSIPDAAAGGGVDSTISLYKNGVLQGKLPVTSRYSWLYGAYPFTNSPASGVPRNFFDEVRTNGLTISAGDVIRLQKDATDTSSYYIIDLVDLENVPAALTQPANSLSIMSYGAGGAGATDDTAALVSCVSAANSQGKSVWLPPGTYKITSAVSLPSNIAIRGAGMWYSTLAGDASVYGTAGRRVALNGNGSNIQLADFAILGRLAYRSDTEPNDGLGGSYGTGSTISRLWVEHAKTGAWIVNSQGLVVDGCRFRNTIADGINFCVGMRSSTITNCTARGTGDDCFAIWPATYTSQTYTPGLNVITHCTGQMPFLANGGAIYGGASNRIEDCLFQDMPYGCGILFSTTFAVGANNFSGITIAQRCDLNRCGGFDSGVSWRGAVQLCLDNKSLSGVNLNNLNISNSISDGLSIVAPGSNAGTGVGTLANAIMSYVSIPNYGLGQSGRHGLWARSDAIGSMTVSNSAIAEYQDDSANFAFAFVTSSIPVTVQSSPAGRSFTVDGTSYSSAQAFNWTPGSSHAIGAASTQSGGTGTQYVWTAWSDAGAISHAVVPVAATNYTVTFATQYFLTMNAGAGGSVGPGGMWTNSGANVSISATASNGYTFSGWTGSGSGSYSGGSNPASVTMGGPITQVAAFSSPQVQVLAFVAQPGNVAEGAKLTPGVEVQAAGASGQSLSNAWITLSLGSGAGNLAGTLTRVTDVSGIARFDDLIFSQAGPKTLAATALTGSAAPASSSSFRVIGAAAALAFTTQPGSAVAGLPFGRQPVLKAVDAFGSPTTNGLPVSLQVYVGLTNGAGALSGTTGYDIGTSSGNGVALFGGLAIDTAGTNQLFASTTSGSAGAPVAGMSIWLDGSAVASVQTNAGGIVTNWLDRSGNGNDFGTTIGSGGGGIRYTNAAPNGLRMVTFNATSGTAGTELKNTTCTNHSGTVSVFVVARKTVPGVTEGAYQHVFATWAGGPNADYADVGSYSLDYNRDNKTPRIIRGCCTAFVDNNCPAMDPSTNCHVFEYIADGTGSNSIWLALPGGTTQGIGPGFGNIAANFNIVASTVGGGMQNETTINNPYAGSIAEVLVYGRVLSADDRASVENYLTNKWFSPGVPFSLAGAVSEPFAVEAAPIALPKNISGVAVGPESVMVTCAATPGFAYHLETTTNLASGTWERVPGAATNAGGDSVVFTDPQPPGGSPRFYRSVSP